MSTATVNLPPLRGDGPLVGKDGKPTPDGHRALLVPYNAQPLQTLDTTAGPATFPLPFAKFNQDVEITFIKISADANVPTLAAQTGDTINSTVAWAAATFALAVAQGTKAKMKSDGVNKWYVTG